MKPQEHHILTQRTARYYSSGNLNKAKAVWIVLHGYGQLAAYFIKHFDFLGDDLFIVAPEGLSRFYLSNSSGRVGASWMTKEDRNHEIEDQFVFLDSVADELDGNLPLNLLGFSQGTATATRWLMRTQRRIDRCVLWGGDIAHDVNRKAIADHFDSHAPLQLAIGRSDEFISSQDVCDLERKLEESAIRFELHRYDGGHKIDPDLLQMLLRQ